MKRPIPLFWWVFSISCAGSLPPGTLNTGVTDLVVNRGFVAAVEFGLGAILVEVALVRLALGGMRRLEGVSGVAGMGKKVGINRLFRWGGVLAGAIVLLLGVMTLKGALRMGGGTVSLWGDRPLLSGVLLSLLNPLHLPFWIGWMVVLRSKKVYGDAVADRNVFSLAVGLGTAVAFLLYGLAGRLFIGWLQVNQWVINWMIAITLLATGLLQLKRVIKI